MARGELKFRFRFIDGRGAATGLLSKRGRFDGETLQLGKEVIPVENILSATERPQRVAFMLRVEDSDEHAMVVIEPYGGASKRTRIVRTINGACSRAMAERRREELTAKNADYTFRTASCPCCEAVIDLSACPPSPQMYCHFCESLSPIDAPASPDESKLRLCDNCGLYSDARQFLIFYFYCLIVLWGMREERRRCCSLCMRPTAWKMFAFNLVFILGVPTALTQLIRSYFFGAALRGDFRQLSRANALARRKRTEEASAIYRSIEQQLGVCAGVKFNHGLAWKKRGPDYYQHAEEHFIAALSDCGNYWPALDALCECYAARGRTQELDKIKAVWSDAGAETGIG